MPVRIFAPVLFCLFLSTSVFGASTPSLETLRTKFLLAEKNIKNRDDAEYFKLAEQLKNYPLYPYLHYQWLRKNLDQNKKIEDFILTYHGTRYAELLKNQWLRHLGISKNWPELIKHYRNTSSAQLQCDYQWAKYNAGQKTTALTAAKKLWIVGHSQPANCDPLFDVLKRSKYFTKDMLWQRFQAAIANGRVQLANYVKGLMSDADAQVAGLWLKVHQHPELVYKSADWHHGYSQAGLVFAHAVDLIAKRNSVTAANIWDKHKAEYTIPNSRIDEIERRLALGLAFRRDKQAYERLSQLHKPDAVVREWQIRTALNEQNWQHVTESLDKLTTEEKLKINWRYWQARAYDKVGDHEQAKALFAQVAEDRSFYGFISANKLDRDIRIADRPLEVSDKNIAELAGRIDFLMVKELRAIGRHEEAKRLWWYAVSKLEKSDIMVAAKLAQQWQWNQVAIFTIARAEYWDDVDLRFPVKFSEHVTQNAEQNDLDPSIVFGLIRRESAFDETAQSPVGARGLMQIMPKTGRQIARDLNDKWRTEKSLFNPELNVKYGTYYYKQLLEQFDGHYALAAAAYNAGPHRVKRWLPEQKPVAADIWIETIPFKETRAYVSAVLTYALIYQERMQRSVLKIKDFMRDILPG